MQTMDMPHRMVFEVEGNTRAEIETAAKTELRRFFDKDYDLVLARNGFNISYTYDVRPGEVITTRDGAGNIVHYETLYKTIVEVRW